MDLYPFWNSLRIAAISCGIVFFLGILCAHYVAKLPRVIKGVLDVILTLPLVLPPTVVGYLLLVLLGPNRIFGSWMMSTFHTRMTMVWYSAVFASAIVAFPLMYRTARGAFESFDPNLRDSARTLGLSNTYIFWRIQMPCCRHLLAHSDALLPAGHPGGHGTGFCPCSGGIRRHLHGGRLYPGTHRHHLHHRVSAVAHQQ